MNKEILLNEVLAQMPRLLGLLDRNPVSSTFGCFDRQYWHYNTVDFACARSQEAVLTLALLYGLKHKNNPYYKNASILEWIKGALIFWTKIQEKNGSFNEWYPKENSFVATAFTSYAISETLLVLNKVLGNDIKRKMLAALEKAAKFLLNKHEHQAQNQESGAAIALYNVYLLTKNRRYLKASNNKIAFISKNQTKEGWFSEYGGADVGYLSLAVDYLSKLYKKSKNPKILLIVKKSTEFISYFIHPNSTNGGEYGSRNTEYLMPHGFAFLAKNNSNAQSILSHILSSIKSKSTISPFSLDDRYLTYITYTWLQAYSEINYSIAKKKPRHAFVFRKNFPMAKIIIRSDPNFYLILNYNKGGSLKIFFKKTEKSLYDSGIWAKTKNGSFTSSWLDSEASVSFKENEIVIRSKLWSVKNNVLSPKKTIFMRLFTGTVGRNERIGLLIKDMLRKKMITKTKPSNILHKRTVTIFAKSIELEDILSNSKELKKIYLGLKTSQIYIPSSRYFQVSELDSAFNIYNNKGKNKILFSRKYDAKGNDLEKINRN